MIKLLFVAILTSVLALALWLGVSTALDLIGIWQKHGIDPDEIIQFGVWFAVGGGFVAPLVLYTTFKTIYRPRRKPPQLPKAHLLPKGARERQEAARAARRQQEAQAAQPSPEQSEAQNG